MTRMLFHPIFTQNKKIMIMQCTLDWLLLVTIELQIEGQNLIK